MKKKIFAYYEPIQEYSQKEEFPRANSWKHTWQNQGWECVMLNRSHAENDKQQSKLMKHVMMEGNRIPQEKLNGFQKMLARHKRWCALYMCGGGWMSDYDVANIAFTPTLAEELEKEKTIHVITGEPAYLFYATQDHCRAAILKFMSSSLYKDGRIQLESDILETENSINHLANLLFHGEQGSPDPKSKQMLKYCT